MCRIEWQRALLRFIRLLYDDEARFHSVFLQSLNGINFKFSAMSIIGIMSFGC